jgi:RNA polymerase sigma-70 factor (ECF subfamily)
MIGMEERFDALVRSHKNAVYRQLLRVCGNHDDAEDALVDTLLQAYRSLDQLRDPASLRAWLVQIGRRACGRLKRREAAMPLVALLGDLASTNSVEEEVIERETKDCLLRALDSLPEHYREVYRLRDVEGMTGEETAQRLGISLPNVKSRLHRARAMLRQRIDSALFMGG